MALDSYATIWGQVLLRCPSAGSLLARSWVSHAFRRVAERRRWSWLMKRGQFLPPVSYTTGTVAVVRNSTTVTGTATVWGAAHVDLQFRIGTATPIYTIASVDAIAQTLELDDEWGGSSATGKTYEIYQCYFPAPSDFHSFVSVWDPSMNWQLHRHFTQNEINTWDSQRAMSGQAYLVASFDYYTPTGFTVPTPRFEIWPHQKAEYVYPFVYEARPTDLDDSGATLPRYIRGDALLEMALSQAALWPGPSEDKKNPYFNPQLAKMHDMRAEQLITEMERQDDEVFEQNVHYAYPTGLPWAPFGDSQWLQRHAV